MNVGDIHWIEFPQTTGREQQGHRPAVILQDEQYGSGLPTVLVIPLSSSTAALRFAGSVKIKATFDSGLRTDSVALVFQCRAIDRSRIRGGMGIVSNDELNAIMDELKKLTGQTDF